MDSADVDELAKILPQLRSKVLRGRTILTLTELRPETSKDSRLELNIGIRQLDKPSSIWCTYLW